MQQDRDRKLLGGKVEGATYHRRWSQKRWAAGVCPSCPGEPGAWPAAGSCSAVLKQLERQRLRMLGLDCLYEEGHGNHKNRR